MFYPKNFANMFMLSPPPPICVVIYVCVGTRVTLEHSLTTCVLSGMTVTRIWKMYFHRLRHPEGFTDIKIFLLKLGVTRTYSKNKYFPLPSLEVKIAHLFFLYHLLLFKRCFTNSWYWKARKGPSGWFFHYQIKHDKWSQ